jgi:hypothetical protein
LVVTSGMAPSGARRQPDVYPAAAADTGSLANHAKRGGYGVPFATEAGLSTASRASSPFVAGWSRMVMDADVAGPVVTRNPVQL